MAGLEPLMRQNFLEYASYVIVDRAIPQLADGLKPVQRRILYTLHEVDDGRFHKVANIIGEAMKLHPHGDASIGDALVTLSNKDYFIEKQGNFGNVITGHRAAAARYIECRLTDLARETLFNDELTQFVASYDGRKKEPLELPVKLPVILMLGTDGIAVGMSTRILPHNLCELWRAQIAILEGKQATVSPDFPQAGIADVSEYDDGRGKVRVRARIEPRGTKKLVISEIPYGTTTESLIASIESAAQKNKVKIASIDDFTTEAVEIELTLARGVDAEEALPQLYAYTDCEVSLSSNIVAIADRHPAECCVSEILLVLTKRLKGLLKAELELKLANLQDRLHWMTLERIFIENRVYKRLEQAKTEVALIATVEKGMTPFAEQFQRELVEDDIKRLLRLAIRRISAFDIEKHQKDLEEVKREVRGVRTKLKNMTRTTVAYLEDLLKRYGSRYPRRTELAAFKAVDKRAVARQTIKVSYDPESSFFGSQVKGSEFALTVSEYDRILIISSDGSYRIVSPPDKMLLPKKVLYCEIFDADSGAAFTVVYRDKSKVSYGKRVRIERYIRDKEYQLIRNKEGRVDLLLAGDASGSVKLKFPPAKRQKIREIVFDLSELDFVGAAARGTRLASKPVSKVTLL